MPRINPVDLNQLDPETAATLSAVKQKLGGLPNIFTTFARSSATLNGYLQLSEALSQGHLTSRQRELIAIAVAQKNQCDYCLSAHAAIGKGLGLKDEDVSQAQQGRAASASDATIVAFALQVIETQGGVSESLLNAVRSRGIDDGIIIEIVSNVVLNIMTNYINRLADTEIDFPVMNVAKAV